MRDIPTIHYLDRIVDRIANYTGQEVIIMSKQMGMVPYSIAKNHYGRVRLIDRVGLVSKDFISCPITSDLPRTREGLDMSYDYYFNNLISLKAKCNVQVPDIIFDLFDPPETVIENGYTVLYYQHGDVNSSFKYLRGGPFNDKQWIAVRNDLLPAFIDFDKVEIDLSQSQLPQRKQSGGIW